VSETKAERQARKARRAREAYQQRLDAQRAREAEQAAQETQPATQADIDRLAQHLMGKRMTSAGYAAYGPLWNKGSEAAARDYTVTGIDLGGVAPTPVADLVHPNDDQHAAIAQTILAGVLLFAEWVNDRLIVQSGPGCLYLIGNGRPSQWIGCDLPEYVLLPYGDAQYVPMGRTLMLVGDGVTRLDVPARVVVRLVWVVGN